jgi:hypothetical protein
MNLNISSCHTAIVFVLSRKNNWWVACVSVCVLSSCESLKESSKYQFVEGYYTVPEKGKKEKFYVLTGSDTIKAYRSRDIFGEKIDTTHAFLFAFPPIKPENFTTTSFTRKTLDFDILTILFKYRFPVDGFPPQLNASFNGALFLGYRTDVYKLSYKTTPMRYMKRSVVHYGYSVGLFSGFGTARIDEYDTKGALNYEYDGLVNLTGVAIIFALDKLTAGLTLGVDHLLDKNSSVWINNGKPWIGLSLGLNLN